MDCYQIRFVVRDGWIKGNKNSQGHYQFKSNDVDRLIQKIHDDYLDIDCASELTDQTLQSFRTTWVISGFVTEYKLGSRKLITQSDFQKILSIWMENKTSVYIANRLGRQRSFCINLEKMGLIKPCLVIGKKARKIKLYPDCHAAYNRYKRVN